MSDFFSVPYHRTARVRHRCIYCGEGIPERTQYVYQTGVYDGSWYANHFHPECFTDLCEEVDGDEFTPYSNERPIDAALGKGE